MAAFGAPGGMEIVVIAVIAALLFVPALAVFAAGYFFGKKSGGGQAQRRDEDVSAVDRETMEELGRPVGEPLPEDAETVEGEREDG